MSKELYKKYARDGAIARLKQLDAERAHILKTFPDLKNGVAGKKPKRTFSKAAKARMSAGMRKYWARRKAEKKD